MFFKYDIRIFCVLATILLLIGNVCQSPVNKTDEIAQYISVLPFDTPSISHPKFPEYSVNIKGFGAKLNGNFDNTSSINEAIQTCAEAGGGKVIVPTGIWTTEPIKLESNINFHLEKGAIPLFISKFEGYPLIETNWEGLPMVLCTLPISGKNLENTAITGAGIIDGAGDKWRFVLKNEMTEPQWKELVNSGGVLRKGYGTAVWWPSEKSASLDKLIEEESTQNIPAPSEITPQFRKIYIDNIVCINTGRAIFLRGLPEMAIKNIEISNAYITSRLGLTSIDARNIKFKNVNIKSSTKPIYFLHNTKNVVISEESPSKDKYSFLRLSGKRTESIFL